MEVYKFLPKVRGGAQRAEGSVVEGKLLCYCIKLGPIPAGTGPNFCPFLQPNFHAEA